MKMLTKDKVQLLAQLIQALDDAVVQLERARNSRDAAQFDKYKKIAHDFQLKVGELLKT